MLMYFIQHIVNLYIGQASPLQAGLQHFSGMIGMNMNFNQLISAYHQHRITQGSQVLFYLRGFEILSLYQSFGTILKIQA